MKSYKVQFVNYGLGSGAMIGHVCGLSGKTYVQSRYKNGRHESELVTIERYHEIIEDIAGAWPQPMRKWIPVFVEVEDAAPADVSVTTNTQALPQEQDYDALTVPVLRKLAREKRKEQGLTLKTESLKRDELIEFLKAA